MAARLTHEAHGSRHSAFVEEFKKSVDTADEAERRFGQIVSKS